MSSSENFDKIIEVNLSFDTMEACEFAATDLEINTDVLFEFEGEQLKVEAKCIDFAKLMEGIEFNPDEIRG